MFEILEINKFPKLVNLIIIVKLKSREITIMIDFRKPIKLSSRLLVLGEKMKTKLQCLLLLAITVTKQNAAHVTEVTRELCTTKKPNILFLMVESTDGRAYFAKVCAWGGNHALDSWKMIIILRTTTKTGRFRCPFRTCGALWTRE